MDDNRSFIAMVFVALLFLPYGCNAARPGEEANLEEAKKAIAESNDIYLQAFVKGDSSIFIDRYAEGRLLHYASGRTGLVWRRCSPYILQDCL